MFPAGNDIALYIAIAGWVLTQLGLMLWYSSLRGKDGAPAPARQNPLALLFFLIQSASIYLIFMPPWHIVHDTESQSAQVQIALVAVVSLAGVALFFWGFAALGKNFAANAQVRETGHLVTSGPYAFVRNPIYLAYYLLLVASGLALANTEHLLIATAVYLPSTAIRILIEERVLRAHFGAEYDEYARRVKRLIPIIW